MSLNTATRLNLGFCGRLSSAGWRRRRIVASGDLFDALTGESMLRGLEERVVIAPAPTG